MSLSPKTMLWSAPIVGCGVAVMVCIGLVGRSPRVVEGAQASSADKAEPDTGIPTVKVIRPKRDPQFRITSQQPAVVEAFYQAGLRSRVAGVVKHVNKDIGDRVRKGELLIEIDVSDLQQEIEQKDAIVDQRRKELQLELSQETQAEAAVELADVNVLHRKTEVTQAEAIRDFRHKRLMRLRELALRGSVNQELVDEQEREFQSSEAALEAARVMVRKAYLDVKEKKAGLEAARADSDLKRVLIRVAEKERDRSKLMADLARITAPFDGVVLNRVADPGVFVQNSSTSNTEPLIVVARDDLMTVRTRLPEQAAPFITKSTETLVEIDGLPGVLIGGKVTRFSPSIDSADRTMRVEVDVYNGALKNYPRFVANRIASDLVPLATSFPLTMMHGLHASRERYIDDYKGFGDALPLCPDYAKVRPGGQKLLTGMSGTMNIYLDQFKDAYLLPSSALVTAVNKQMFIYLLKDGIVRIVQVQVQVNDGRLAKVSVVIQGKGADKRTDVTEELTGKEEVILNPPSSLQDGERVRIVYEPW